jgi:general secretion pathway protein N
MTHARILTGMRAPAIAALGIAAYLLFLVVLLPASLVAPRLGGAFLAEFSDVRGTVWSGSARATLRTPQGPVELERIEWTFRPARVLAGRIAFDVTAAANGIDGRARIERGFTTTEMRDLDARADAVALALFAPLAATWQPQGAITAMAPLLAWDGTELRGEARAEWRGAAVALSQVRPLGSYRGELKGAGGPARVTLTTLEGPLRLTGDGTLTSQGRLAFSGEARGEGTAAPALEPLLDLMGPRRADGARALRWNP